MKKYLYWIYNNESKGKLYWKLYESLKHFPLKQKQKINQSSLQLMNSETKD